MGKLDGKVALITGAARGQGRNHAIRLAQEGANIIAVDSCTDIEGVPYAMPTRLDLDETARAVEQLDRRVFSAVADVRDAVGLAAVVQSGVAELGRLDIVCANAGISGAYEHSPDLATRVESFRRVIDINLTGVYCTIEASREALVASGDGGSIIITNSLAGLKGLGAGGGYGESKHGLVGLMRGYARSLAPHFIRVNSVHPTNVLSPMINNQATFNIFRPDLTEPTLEDAEAGFQSMNLLPIPYVKLDDISAAVVWLASDDSRYVTGVSLPVDAGASVK